MFTTSIYLYILHTSISLLHPYIYAKATLFDATNLKKLWKVPFIVTFFRKYTRALTFQNFWAGDRTHCNIYIYICIYIYIYTHTYIYNGTDFSEFLCRGSHSLPTACQGARPIKVVSILHFFFYFRQPHSLPTVCQKTEACQGSFYIAFLFYFIFANRTPWQRHVKKRGLSR